MVVRFASPPRDLFSACRVNSRDLQPLHSDILCLVVQTKFTAFVPSCFRDTLLTRSVDARRFS